MKDTFEMEEFQESTYGDRIAEVYDEMYAQPKQSRAALSSMVGMLAGTCGQRTESLELGNRHGPDRPSFGRARG